MSGLRVSWLRVSLLALAGLLFAGGAAWAHGGGGHGGGGHGGGFGGHAGIGHVGGIGGFGHHAGLAGTLYGSGFYRGFGYSPVFGRGYASGLGYGFGLGNGLGLGLGYPYHGYGSGLGFPYYGYGRGYPYYGYSYGQPNLGYNAGYGYTPYYGRGAAYSNPSVNTYSYYSPSATAQAQGPPRDDKAHLLVVVPANAQLWFNGTKTKRTGTQREFISPELKPGKRYSYDVKASWTDDEGKKVEKARTVQVQANNWKTVDFTKPEPVARKSN